MKILALIAAAVAAGAVVPAFAAPEGTATAIVRYDDLDLSNAQGRATLDNRVTAAARHVCSFGGSTLDLAQRAAERSCYKSTLANTRTEVAALTGTVYAAR